MNIRLKFLIISLVLVLFYAAYYWLTPAIINAENHVPIVGDYIKKELGYKVEIKNLNLKMGLTPSVWVRADDFSILNDDNTSALNIKKPTLKVQLLPLILGRTEIRYFSADAVKANLTFDKSSHWKLGNYMIVGMSDPKVSLKYARVLVNNYDIRLDDLKQNKKMLLKGDYFKLDKFHPKHSVKFSTFAKLKVNDRVSSLDIEADLRLPVKKNIDENLNVDATITNLNLGDFSPYVVKMTKNDIKSLSGLINIEVKTPKVNPNKREILINSALENLAIIRKDKPASVYFNDKLELTAVMEANDDKVKFNKFAINSNNLHANITGSISDLKKKFPILDLNIAVPNSRLENFISLLPGDEKLSPDINLFALKKYGYYGDVSGNLSIKGSAQEPELIGKIISTEGYVIKPIPNAKKATVKLTFSKKIFNMDITVPCGPSDVVFVKGDVELYGDKHSILHITGSKAINLSVAKSVLDPLHEIFRFDMGPVPIMGLDGLGTVNLKVVGNKKNPHIWGEFNFRNTTASFNDVHNMQLRNGLGTLYFNDADTHFVTSQAVLNGKPMKIDGHCSLFGVLDYDVFANAQDLGDLLNILKTSPMLSDIQKLVEPIDAASGTTDFYLKLTGKIPSIDEVIFGKTIFAQGKLTLKGANVYLKNFKNPVKNTYGVINYKNTDVDFDLTSFVESSKVAFVGKIKNDVANVKVTSAKFRLSDGLAFLNNPKYLKYAEVFSDIYTKFTSSYNGSLTKINLKNISMKSSVIPTNSTRAIKITRGDAELKNSMLKVTGVKGSFKSSPFVLSAYVYHLGEKDQLLNADLDFDKFDVSVINTLPVSIKKHIAEISDVKGQASVKAFVRNNNTNAIMNLNNVTFNYGALKMPVKIISGDIKLQNNALVLNKVNSILDSMPLLIDGKISDIFKKPTFNLYVNSKPTQAFVEKYINNKAIYPLKLKGDIVYSAKISGNKDLLNAKTQIKMEEKSNIYYMGSTIGDNDNPIRLNLDADFSKNKISIKNFQYDKLISSQNNRQFTSAQVNASGGIYYGKNNVSFSNFRVKTENPTDAKIFNFLFKKPLIKQGLFTSDLYINGSLTSPNIKGDFNLTGVDIPFLDTTIKDISFDFKNNNIYISSRGEIFGNSVILKSNLQNKLTTPFILNDAEIYFADLDINAIMNSLKNMEIEADKHKISSSKQEIDLSSFVIKNAKVKADKVSVKNIRAQNLDADISLSEKMLFSVDNFKFDVAQGKVQGDLKYNLLSNLADLNMNILNVNANSITDALFDLPGQVYGSLTGDVSLRCNGKSHKDCMRTLSGRGGFEVAQGRMPKLGSLEYLLKAGNLVKSGVTGLSLNSLIDLVTPLKTGTFETIRGNFYITDGIADSVQLFSKGKDLSMFLTGKYNFATVIADFHIFGRLSKKVTNVLGPVGNASLNTLFNCIPGLNLDEANNNAQVINELNKVPGIELNDKNFRVFAVEIYGDINGDNYVKSFRWVE